MYVEGESNITRNFRIAGLRVGTGIETGTCRKQNTSDNQSAVTKTHT
jgi:hypothetical protein